jgi:raffinose/stachyose/melibiose transport system substrate-binding protein
VRTRYLTVALAAALVLAGCGGDGDDDASGSGKASGSAGKAVTIEILTIQQPEQSISATLRTLMDEFAKTHPGSTLKETYVPQDQLDQKLQLLAGQNDLPEMFFAPNTPAGQADFAEQGLALDLEETLNELGVFDMLDPAAAQVVASQQGGKVYALPFELNVEGFWYNKAIFEENGLTPPATWDELSAAAEKLDAAGVQPFSASGLQGWPLTRLVSGYLFRKLGPDALRNVVDGSAQLTDPEYLEAASLLAEWGDNGYFGNGFATLDYGPAVDTFLQGDAAMIYMGSWVLGDFNDEARNKIGGPDGIGFFPLPTVSGGAGTAEQNPTNAGLPVMVSADKYTPEVGEWLTFIAENYGDVTLEEHGAVSGFVTTAEPPELPSTTRTVLDAISATTEPLQWFEAPMSPKAGSVAMKNAASLANGNMSPEDFMSQVQDAQGD